jgi:hypothetical protein
MPDQLPTQPPPNSPSPSAPAPASAEPATNFNIGEEFGTAKRNLPPARIVLICIAAVAVVIAIIAFQQRPKPQGGGSIDLVSAAEVPGPADGPKNLLVAVTLTLRNTAQRSLWIHTLKAQLTTADGHTYEDEAASAIDLDRYFQAFPVLKESSEPPLPPETKLPPGTNRKGTIMFSFPVAREAFDKRKSLEVQIQPYDQPLPIILK